MYDNSLWDIKEHLIPASHVRGFARGLRNEQTGLLRLSVKQYTPRANSNPQPDDATIIFAENINHCKEGIEPFLDELLRRYPRIRNVWAADTAWRSRSYLANEDVIGDEPHWVDAARDLLQMVNYFQTEMPLPIVGLACSWGVATLFFAAQLHPRLFAGIIAIEPTLIARARTPGENPKNHLGAQLIRWRNEWPSLGEARKALTKHPMYASYHPAVLDRIIKYDLRIVKKHDDSAKGTENQTKNATTDNEPKDEDGPVVLTTPKAMEVYTVMRPTYGFSGFPTPPAITPPDNTFPVIPGFSRPELYQLHKQTIPSLHPPVLYVWGKESFYTRIPGYRKFLLAETGTGVMGSGGVKAGAVKEAMVERAQHPLTQQEPIGGAEAVAPWLKELVEKWVNDREKRVGTAPFFTSKMNPEWVERVNKL